MQTDEMQMLDMKKNNSVTFKSYLSFLLVLLINYSVKMLDTNNSILKYVVLFLIALSLFGAIAFEYSNNKASDRIKYITAIGFAIFYSASVFCLDSHTNVIYAILAVIGISVYGDEKVNGIFSGYLTIISFIHIIYIYSLGNLIQYDISDRSLEILLLPLACVIVILINRANAQKNNQKLDVIKSDKESVTSIIGDVMEVSENITSNIALAAAKLEKLESSVSKTKLSMEEVSNGTAESVQIQLIKTEEIQNFIKKVESVSDSIGQDMTNTNNEVQAGKDKVEELINQVNVSEEVSIRVSDELKKLTEYANKMQSIIGMIDAITSQTSLLSLNASIEAARVGEAGKGFAVVASEISNLSDQTQDATEDITKLIDNLSDELEMVVTVINYLMDNNKLQSIAITETASNFETIASMTDDMDKNFTELSELIVDLATSNESIVESIQTISTVTEEVTAHSNEKLESSEENSLIVEEVQTTFDKINEMADRLRQLENY